MLGIHTVNFIKNGGFVTSVNENKFLNSIVDKLTLEFISEDALIKLMVFSIVGISVAFLYFIIRFSFTSYPIPIPF